MRTQRENLKLHQVYSKENRINKPGLGDGKNGSCIYSIPTVTRLTRNRNNLRPLPVIEEEDVCYVEDDLDIKNYFFSNSVLKDPYLKRKTFNILLNNKLGKKVRKTNNSFDSCEKITETVTNIPRVLNINCMMNTKMKQSEHIWETNFGKRLINGKTCNSYDEAPFNARSITEEHQEEIEENKLGDSLSNNMESKFSTEALINGSGDTDRDTSKNAIKKVATKYQRKKLPKVTRHSKRKRSPSIDATEVSNTNPVVKEYDIMEENEGFENSFGSSLEVKPSSLPLATRQQHLLTQCVRSILQCSADKIICDICNEALDNFGELLKHKKIHDMEKQTCLICNKEFSRTNEFVQHLLMHESVDKFSCKKCRKYFPTLEGFKRHELQFHYIGNEISKSYAEIQSTDNWGFMNFQKFKTNYECERCKLAFDTEEEQRAHKLTHLKMNLTAAKLLCPEFNVM
ncbi:hypothetical protein RUM44_000072 [Polyplax serrata]|uniref:C2H2-type domain-containing protein n=1 Tax=Polyplax serrata TaxID=468196 RepID=A0ABR1B4E2_POLSC